MMTVAIDPSETRATGVTRAPEAARRPALGRMILLGALGIGGLAALSVAANALLAGFAGPPPMPIALNRNAAAWPDLKDGVPDLVSRSGGHPAALPAAATEPATTATASAAPIATVASADPDALAPGGTVPTPAVDAALRPSLGAPRDVAAERPVPAKAAKDPAKAAAAVARTAAIVPMPPRRPPMIENAAVIGPVREAPVLAPTKVANAVAPLRSETVRARSSDGTFAALPPDSAKARPKAAAKGKPGQKPAEVAQAAPAQPAAEAESETTEIFGLKVPSLAPAGRKIQEGIEALGNAVRGGPDKH
ncbi:hypothetical protein [Methylobacterium nigriterrae]|uniref:hypothetical protein n=1 Tax=Methylobacterium nigriterrae TaxID=3127512 RepID=UPI003013DE8E